MATAGASDSTLATMGGGTTPGTAGPLLGPGLFEGMGESLLLARLNDWGADRDAEIVRLRSDLAAAQTGVSGAFSQAERAPVGLAND